MIHKSDRVVITGCGGMLGEAVYDVFEHFEDESLTLQEM